MENLDKKEQNKTAKKPIKKQLSSNPIDKVKSPIEGLRMISVPQEAVPETQDTSKEIKKTKKKLDSLIKPISVAEEASLDSIVETINNFNTTKTKPKLYTNNYNPNNNIINPNVNYFDLMKGLLDTFQSYKSMADLFARLNSLFINKAKWNFIGFGLLHEKSKCIILKIQSKTGNTYSSKIFLSD